MLVFLSDAGCMESFLSRLWVGLGRLPKPCFPLGRPVMPRPRWVPCASPCSPPGAKPTLPLPTAGCAGVFQPRSHRQLLRRGWEAPGVPPAGAVSHGERREQSSPGTKHRKVVPIKWEIPCVELTLTPYVLFGCQGRVFEQERRLSSCLQDNDQLLPPLLKQGIK